MGQYFSEKNDEYIIRFLEADDPKEKDAIFVEGIKPAFEKLIENLMYVYGFCKIDDVDTLKRDCLTNLYEMLPKFDKTRGKKGFSYFNVIARNWFIQKAREKSKKSERELELPIDTQLSQKAIKPEHISCSSCEDEIIENEFWISLFKELELWRCLDMKKNEKKVLEAAIYLIQNSNEISIYNKKAVYIYLKDMTGLNEKQIATTLKKLREMYVSWNNRFIEEGM